ncbi:hypothetical protein [Nakamurella endophytica]|uniref:hypothetical protein n=1 Tax=Nakamurella endophytica TaxID=1748367 RepID=UPI0016632FC3|nr:hypothetical protein [Nakamurella endophytica]
MTTDRGPVRCSVCGATAADPAVLLQWMYEPAAARPAAWTCPDCQRDVLRGIESRLPPEWW